MPFFKRVRDILHIGKKTDIPKFNFCHSSKWLAMSYEGYSTEGFIGHYNCPHCTSRVNLYRAVAAVVDPTLRATDMIRFEQTVENSSGRMVMQVPLDFEKHFTAQQKADTHCVPHQELGLPCECEVVKEEFFATCKCMCCGEALSFWNQVKWCEDMRKFRWFLTKKEDKVVEAEVEAEVEVAEEDGEWEEYA